MWNAQEVAVPLDSIMMEIEEINIDCMEDNKYLLYLSHVNVN